VTWGNAGPHGVQLKIADKDEVPGSSPGRPTINRRRSEHCRRRVRSAGCRLGPHVHPGRHVQWPSGSAHPGVRLGDDHAPWSRTQPEDGSHAAGAATSHCSLLPCPQHGRRGPHPDPAARVRHRPPTNQRDFGSIARVPASATIDRAVDGPASTGPPPDPVVTVTRPPRLGPRRLRGRRRTCPDGRGGRTRLDTGGADSRRPTAGPSGRPQVTGHRTAGQLDPDADAGSVDTACWTPATDAVACLLAGSTTATTPDRLRPAGGSSGQTSSGRATTRTAQPQGLRGHPRCHGWVWRPPRRSAAGGTPPSSRRLGALLSSDDYGSRVEQMAEVQVLWRAPMWVVEGPSLPVGLDTG
jgi:hypothetical protein